MTYTESLEPKSVYFTDIFVCNNTAHVATRLSESIKSVTEIRPEDRRLASRGLPNDDKQ